jgi:hypothetical protein
MKQQYEVCIFGESFFYDLKEDALNKARESDYSYANGFVQVYDRVTDCMIYGLPR